VDNMTSELLLKSVKIKLQSGSIVGLWNFACFRQNNFLSEQILYSCVYHHKSCLILVQKMIITLMCEDMDLFWSVLMWWHLEHLIHRFFFTKKASFGNWIKYVRQTLFVQRLKFTGQILNFKVLKLPLWIM
jgi:hypothetical protein